ncbi:hypothetical protein Tco_0157687 [Tanacetum coccineum]
MSSHLLAPGGPPRVLFAALRSTLPVSHALTTHSHPHTSWTLSERAHEVELSVLCFAKSMECVDNSLHAEIEHLKKKSIEIQEGLQARIKILEKDLQRCEKQNELIAHVSEKTYAYGAIHAENQNLLFSISELKTKLANAEKGYGMLSVAHLVLEDHMNRVHMSSE